MSRNSGVLWHVVAPVVRWPLWSPRRLALVVALIVAAVLGLSIANGSDAPATPTGVVTPTPSPATEGVPTP
jgi:hypothetical protein